MKYLQLFNYRRVSLSAYVIVFAVSIAFLASCQRKEFYTGTDIVNGDKISIGEVSLPVKAWSVKDFSRDTLSGRAHQGKIWNPSEAGSNIMQFFFNMVGNYEIPDVCKVEAGFAANLQLLTSIANFGDIIVDSVEMHISYTPLDTLVSSAQGYLGYYTNLEIYKGVMSPHEYMVYGNPYNHQMNLEIYRLAEEIPDETYTNDDGVEKANFIPITKKWALAEKIHAESFYMETDTIKSKTNVVDTVITYDYEGMVQDCTYVYADSIYPRINIKLDKEYWQGIMDEWAGKVMTMADFSKYFKGLYFKAADGVPSPLFMLDLYQGQGDTRTAEICIYYRTSSLTGQRAYLTFNSTGAPTNSVNSIQVTYDPAINAMLENPDTLNGEEDLYILPFGGSEVVVDLISDDNIKMIRDNGWIINEAYIEFKNKGQDISTGNFPVVELWMYRHPYGYQFIYFNDKYGYPVQKVDYYLPDEAIFTESAAGGWLYTPQYNYGLNGIINQNSESTKFEGPGIYRMHVTRTLIDVVYGGAENVKLGLRLPLGVTQISPFMSILDGRNLELKIKYTKLKENAPSNQ